MSTIRTPTRLSTDSVDNIDVVRRSGPVGTPRQSRPTSPRSGTVRAGSVSRTLRTLRHRLAWGQATTTFLLLLVVSAVAMAVIMWPQDVPRGLYAPLAVVAGLFLRPGWLMAVDVVMAAWVVVVLVLVPDRASPGLVGSLVVIVGLMMWLSTSRARLGVSGIGGEQMLVDLRDRLRLMGEIPQLPTGWHAESAIEPAHGDAFSGDFMVTTRSPGNDTFELVVVDVSGKGLRSGTRSLLLSGAFSGLLGSTDAEGFLPAANNYLVRQAWGEGFATAVHVQICLRTGFYTVATAGHPPAVAYSAGSGRWSAIEGDGGPLLGVLEAPPYPRRSGQLQRGDALLLYTDGVVESRTRDMADGIDRMLGTAERHVKSGFSGLARRICTSARSGESDDRAVVLVWRS